MSLDRRPNSHTSCFFLFFFCCFGDVSLYREYVVRFFLPGGLSLPCDHGLDFFTSAYVRNQSINQSINQSRRGEERILPPPPKKKRPRLYCFKANTSVGSIASSTSLCSTINTIQYCSTKSRSKGSRLHNRRHEVVQGTNGKTGCSRDGCYSYSHSPSIYS